MNGIFSQRLIPRISGGLVPAYELLINNSAVSNLIREKRTHEIDVVIETGMESGMIDLNHSLLELVRKGEIIVQKPALVIPPNNPQFYGFDFDEENKIDQDSLINLSIHKMNTSST